jgi:hypothetical protein
MNTTISPRACRSPSFAAAGQPRGGVRTMRPRAPAAARSLAQSSSAAFVEESMITISKLR